MARNKYDIDEELEEKFDLKNVKRLKKYLTPYRKTFALTIFMMALSSVLSIGFLLVMKDGIQVIEEYVNKSLYTKDYVLKRVVIDALIITGITFVNAFLQSKKITLTTKIGQGVIHSLRYDIFEHLQQLPFSYYDDKPHGKIQVRVVNYVNELSDLLSNGIVNTITDMFSLIFIIIIMFALNVKFALIAMCGLPILIVAIAFVKTKQRRGWRLSSNKTSNLNAYISESINGIRVTQSFVREEENEEIFRRLNNDSRKYWMKAVIYNFMLGPIVDFITTVTISVIYVWAIYMMIGGVPGITVALLTTFSGYISRFWAPITTMANFYNSMMTAVSYLERIFGTIDEPVIVRDVKDAIDMPKIVGNVAFKNVSFSYEDNVKILSDINFSVKAGESVAIVGPTGAGKTTIVNLISRFYNLDSGLLTIDDIDISKVKLKSLRSQMGIMMQDSFIFSGTIMDNIRYGNMDATDEEVIAAAKTVCAHDFIEKLEAGYNTEVNERGSRLSAGQRQLISFARAILADPKILILDEATSSIDTETEILLQKGLARLLEGRTSFIIAHRLSTIKNSNCIMYIDDGRIVEKGTHDELMKNPDGEYYKLYMSQYDFLAK